MQNQKGLQCESEIEEQYREAQKQIEGQIRIWYQRFAEPNGVNLQEARRMLTNRERKELKSDLNEYIRYGKENAVNSNWQKQLEHISGKSHISRLDSLKLQMQQSVESMFASQQITIDSAMQEIYQSGYYHTAFELQKGIGVGWKIAALDEGKIAKVMQKPWAADGKNFSERIWSNRQKLVNELHSQVSRSIILGQDPQQVIDIITKKLDTSKKIAERLVMTEEAFFSGAAQKDCFEELGVEQYEIVATLDSHTSKICHEMDGKVFPMSQWEVGVTAPPFHVWCRTTTVPAFGDQFERMEKRAVRDEDGETYHIPEDISYEEWQRAFVEDGIDTDKNKKYNNLRIKFPDDIMKINGMTPSIRKQLDFAIQEMMEEYEIRLSSLTVEPAGKGDLFVVGWYDGKMGMVINSNADFEKIIKIIPRRYEAGFLAGGSLEDYIAHEMFHIMAYQDCKTEQQYRAKYMQIENSFKYLKGISKYADKSGSGNEALAEAFVRIRNGEEVPAIAKVLVEVYVGRWRK